MGRVKESARRKDWLLANPPTFALDAANENSLEVSRPRPLPESLRINEYGLPHASHAFPLPTSYREDNALAGELQMCPSCPKAWRLHLFLVYIPGILLPLLALAASDSPLHM